MDMTAPAAHDPARCRDIARHLGWIGDRWTLPVVVVLATGTLCFNGLRRAVAGISQQMLTRTLRRLERDGVVTRTVHPTVPPMVEYALTPLGHSLAALGQDLGRWVVDHERTIHASQAEFDARATAD
ncbi:helix-turn-helix transcriptional regulator [Sphingomonas sp. R647]|uniref:winged helix-turn-helix transcriptional regulator n=1 Tax=Sphingomonas sp. R647 TaxID=2875233 RepID=UPI001CD7EB5B|nr:helix-turn-helix domain-containing protein [Sphingomonas sp. R647]MCA1199645.1 helix-turn-helix transcriptional regulator [Sphingomonas sp. R647]